MTHKNTKVLNRRSLPVSAAGIPYLNRPRTVRMAQREYRTGISVLAFCIVFIAILTLPATVSADKFVGGIPLTTVQTGTITGDLWFDATPAPDWGDKIVTKTFVLPSAAVAQSGRITWARLYISVYSGHMQNDYAFTVTNSWDGDGVSGYEQVWPETGHAAFQYINESEEPYGPLGNDNSALGGGYHDPYKMINDHENRVTSDYFMWYDVTSMISNETVFVNVDSTGSYDGRIKMITLVVAYDDPNSVTQTTYWVNQGHDICSYYTETNSYEAAVGTTTFGTTGLTGVTSAVLTADYLASNNGYYGFPTSQNNFEIDYPPPDYETTVVGNFTNMELDRDPDDQGPYSGLDSWDVTSSVTGSSDSTLGYSRYFPGSGTAAFFKIPLAFLVVKSPLPVEAPVAQFAADVVAGTAPLTVQFTDESTNDPTEWEWTFGDGGTSDQQNPSHEYTAAGTFTVTLTATNSAGSDVEEKNGYVTVTPNYNPTAAFSATPLSGTVPLVVQFTDASTSLGSSEERVTNGGFETGTLDGWTKSSDNSAYSAYVSGIPTNHAVIGFGGPGVGTGTVTLSQDVDLTDVGSLAFSYQYTGGCEEEGGTYQAEVLIGDIVVWQTTTPTESGWQAVTIDATSYSGTQVVKFRASVSGFDSPGESWLYLDDISAASEGGITAWAWTFGDGGTSDLQNPGYEYSAADTYPVTLTVTDANGSDSEVKENYITVSPAVIAPVAAFSGTPTSGTAPLTVLFTDESLNDPTSRVWNFGDGNTSWSSTETTFAHTFASAAVYNVTLTVENDGGSDSETKTGYITVSAAPQIDLTISGLVNTVPASAVFAREPNAVKVINVKNQGTDTATNIVVAIYASDVSTTVPVAMTTIASLAAGATTTVTVSDPTIRDLEGGTVTYTAKVDPDNLIAETNEANNNKASSAKPLKYNGYKGKGIYWEGGSNITTKHTFDLNGNMVYYTPSASYYRAVDWTDRTETWTAAELPVPEGATIEKVYLYISYNWDQTPAGVPDMNTVFNGNTLTLGTPYMDKSNFGAYADYEYGLYPAIDVTSMFIRNGDNTLVMTPNGDNKEALYPSTLAVIYSDPTETRKQIFINEECDEVLYSEVSYGTTMEEATAYAEFSGMTIDTANVRSATLHSFAGSAGPDEGNLLFNGQTIATNAWQGSSSTGSAQSFDVKNYLAADGNVAGIQGTTSGGMDALQQILVVEYTQSVVAPVAAFSAEPVSGTTPLIVLFTDESTNSPTSRVWDFGDGNNTWSTMETTFAHTYESAGTFDVTLSVENSAGSDSEVKEDFITATAGVITLPGFTDPPTDPDSDGLYEDLNANGRKDYNDLQVFYSSIVWMAENEPVTAFDFNGNGRIDFNDLQVLYTEMV